MMILMMHERIEEVEGRENLLKFTSFEPLLTLNIAYLNNLHPSTFCPPFPGQNREEEGLESSRDREIEREKSSTL